MIKITDLKLPASADEREVRNKCLKILGVADCDIKDFYITKKSIDARDKSHIAAVYAVAVSLDGEDVLVKKIDKPYVQRIETILPEFPVYGGQPRSVVVCGSGPCGLFAGLVLAKAGLKPVILERGKDVDRRKADVEAFWQTGTLHPSSNVQFGEGGAGTFSDGKLNTGTVNPYHTFILQTFINHGAPKEIAYAGKPHIGTDYLMGAVKGIRQEIEAFGGRVLFEHCLTDMKIKDNRLYEVEINHTKRLEADALLLAVGHSARDTFLMLYGKGVNMIPKAFSVGVRIEHLQRDINESQYGKDYDKSLPPADYKLSCHLPNGRGVYTFCMCPGGVVVNSASEAGGMVTNGMSYYKRNGDNANSAVLVSVYPEDFRAMSLDPLGGLAFQRQIEEKAFALTGGYHAPMQLVGDFLQNRISKTLGKVKPTVLPSPVFADLRACLPPFVTESITSALPIFARKIKTFGDLDEVLTAPETRSSSPVRLLREQGQSNILGLYPAGEGAGYAGGILSAAADGIEQAVQLMKDLQ